MVDGDSLAVDFWMVPRRSTLLLILHGSVYN